MERITIFKGFTVPVIIKVDEKQKVVTAYNTRCEFLAVNTFDKLAKDKSQVTLSDYSFNFYERIKMKSTYKAKARCQESDVFDVNIGKELAKEKLAKKLRSSIKKRINAMLLENMKLHSGVLASSGYKEL